MLAYVLPQDAGHELYYITALKRVIFVFDLLHILQSSLSLPENFIGSWRSNSLQTQAGMER